jgi:hypothetical protein
VRARPALIQALAATLLKSVGAQRNTQNPHIVAWRRGLTPDRGSGEGPDSGKMADPRKSAGAVEEAPVGGDVGTVEFHREGEEGGIVEGEAEFPAQAGGALQEGCGGWSHDDVYLEGPGFYLLQEGARLFEEILIARLEPLDEDRGVNDELRGRNGSRDGSE